MPVTIAWSWLLYLWIPLRPTSCRFSNACEVFAQHVEGLEVLVVVHRIRLRHAHHRAVDRPSPDRPGRSPPVPACPSSISSSSLIVHSPSPSKQKYSRPRQVFRRSGTISGLQFLKFWMRPSFTLGIVHVDPVVGEQSPLIDDQRDGQEVAIRSCSARRARSAAAAGDNAWISVRSGIVEMTCFDRYPGPRRRPSTMSMASTAAVARGARATTGVPSRLSPPVRCDALGECAPTSCPGRAAGTRTRRSGCDLRSRRCCGTAPAASPSRADHSDSPLMRCAAHCAPI